MKSKNVTRAPPSHPTVAAGSRYIVVPFNSGIGKFTWRGRADEVLGACGAWRGVRSLELYIGGRQPFVDPEGVLRILPIEISAKGLDRYRRPRVNLLPYQLGEVPYAQNDEALRKRVGFTVRADPADPLKRYGNECATYLAQHGFPTLFRFRFRPWERLQTILALSVQAANRLPKMPLPFFLVA